MRRWLAKLVDVRSGEGLLTLLMCLYYYVILVTYYLLKPARDSLFLVKLGAEQLPIVFIITALIIAPITTLYSKASRQLKLTRLLYVTAGLLIVNLIVLRWLLTYEASWVFYLFYVWVSIYGAMSASQFWLFANAVYTPSQGRRLFVLLNLGGIVGAMTGGELTSLIVRRLGVRTEDLLFVCMFLLALVMALIAAIWKLYSRGTEEKPQRTGPGRRKAEGGESFLQMVGTIKRSRHLTYLVGIIALTMATASFVDFQFKTVSAAAFPDKEALTSFLGVFYGRLSLASLVLQLVFGYRILRLLGVAGIVLFLPLGLLLGSTFMLIAPGIVAATLLRGADGAFKYSLDKTGRELLFLPIPLEVKKRTKVFIDMFVDRWFRGLAGAVLLLLTGVLGLGVRQLSVVVIALLLTWISLVLLIRKEYVNAFREALRRREIDPSQLTVNISDAATMKTLRDALRSGNERDIVYALSMLKGTRDRDLAGDLVPLLGHASRDVRLGALLLLSDTPGDHEAAVEPLVRDSEEEIRWRAIHLLVDRAGDGARDVLARFIGDEDERVAASALRCAGAVSGAAADVAESDVERLENSDDSAVRAELARALGELGDVRWHGVIRKLMNDDDTGVAGAAISAAGASRNRSFVPDLIARLADGRLRRYVREALVAYGNHVVGTLGDYLGDDTVDVTVRRNIPAVLSRIPTQQSVDTLAENLAVVDSSVRFLVVKALNKLRRAYPDLRVQRDRVDAAFIAETRLYYEALQITMIERRDTAADRLLQRALNERLQLNLERCFRLLGLQYPADDIYNAYLGLVSPQRDRHASAIEFLDNVVGKKLKSYLLPIIDPISESDTLARGCSLFNDLGVRDRDEALLRLMQSPDAWLRALAVFCAADSESQEVRDAAKACRKDRDPVVAETAHFVSRSFAA